MIAIGCDHAGYPLKQELLAHLYAKGIAYEDLGCDGTPCDYPRIAQAVCEKIISGSCECGILICGTGIGMSIAANKIPGIRLPYAPMGSVPATPVCTTMPMCCALGRESSAVDLHWSWQIFFWKPDLRAAGIRDVWI